MRIIIAVLLLLLCNTANSALDKVFNQAGYLPQQPFSMSELYPFNSEQRTPRSIKSGKIVLKINEHSSRLQVVKSDVAKKQSASVNRRSADVKLVQTSYASHFSPLHSEQETEEEDNKCTSEERKQRHAA